VVLSINTRAYITNLPSVLERFHMAECGVGFLTARPTQNA